ncbi:MAG: phosphoribosylaminoimidazolesuccinocarboxamide synthase, partial [Naasia sp.]
MTGPSSAAPAELAGWDHVYSGKVRDLYRESGRTDGPLLVVASDRVSAFDHVLEPGIPGKGTLLTTLSRWWFDALETPNHLLDPSATSTGIPASVADRAMLVRPLD